MRRTGMDKAREILRQHFEVGLSQREISKSVKVSLGTVSGILARARAAGIGYPIGLIHLASILVSCYSSSRSINQYMEEGTS